MKRFRAMGLASLTGLALVAPGMPQTAAAADLALVIGNRDYRLAPDATGARIDADAVADALERGGYEVISGVDLSRTEMRRDIARFADRVDEADRVVVFYSGHALRSGGVTYLAPVGQGAATLVDVMMDGVPLDLVLRLAGEASGQAVAFVDAARLDGFTPKSFVEPGIAEIDAPGGVLVVSATAPGRAIARRSERQSEFARQVLERFLAPGRRIGEATSGLGGSTWIGGEADSSLVLVSSADGRASGDAEGGSRAPSASQVESRLDLDARERRRLQRTLNRLGYDTRGTEGVFGPGTRSAIRGWQQANDFSATGYLTAEQLSELRRQRKKGAGMGADGRSAAEIETRLDLNVAERREIQERLTNLGFDPRGTDGVFGSGTRTAIRNWQRANDSEETGYLTEKQVARIIRQSDQPGRDEPEARDPAAVENSLDLTRGDRRSIEQRLAHLGFSPGEQDGFFDENTRRAIKAYQRDRGRKVTGYLDRDTVAAIIEETQDAPAGFVEEGAKVLQELIGGIGEK